MGRRQSFCEAPFHTEVRLLSDSLPIGGNIGKLSLLHFHDNFQEDVCIFFSLIRIQCGVQFFDLSQILINTLFLSKGDSKIWKKWANYDDVIRYKYYFYFNEKENIISGEIAK